MSRHSSPGFDFTIPPLDAEDEHLIEAYRSVGRSLDDLPYTPDFDRLCGYLGKPLTDEARHMVYKRLVSLRKRGRLPRVYVSSESGL